MKYCAVFSGNILKMLVFVFCSPFFTLYNCTKGNEPNDSCTKQKVVEKKKWEKEWKKPESFNDQLLYFVHYD